MVLKLNGLSSNRTQVNTGKVRYETPKPSNLTDQAESRWAYANFDAKKAKHEVGIARSTQIRNALCALDPFMNW